MNIKRPDCVGCAKCCLGVTDISEDDYLRLKDYAYQNEKGYFMNRKPFGDMNVCIFLDTENYKCSNYENRPTACEEYLPGGEGCIYVLSQSPSLNIKKINEIWT